MRGRPIGGSLSGNAELLLTVTFSPGGNFDWVFGVRMGGAFNGSLTPGNRQSATWLQDFSSTAILSYRPFTGATVFSPSGVFPGTHINQVPAPGCLLRVMLGSALAATATRQCVDTAKR